MFINTLSSYQLIRADLPLSKRFHSLASSSSYLEMKNKPQSGDCFAGVLTISTVTLAILCSCRVPMAHRITREVKWKTAALYEFWDSRTIHKLFCQIEFPSLLCFIAVPYAKRFLSSNHEMITEKVLGVVEVGQRSGRLIERGVRGAVDEDA